MIKSGRRRLDATSLPNSQMDLSIPVAPTLPHLPGLSKEIKEKLCPLQEQAALNTKVIFPYSIQGSASLDLSSPGTLKAPSAYGSMDKSSSPIRNSLISEHDGRISSKGSRPIRATITQAKGIFSIYI